MAQRDDMIIQLSVLQKGVREALASVRQLRAQALGVESASGVASKGLQKVGTEAKKAGTEGAKSMKALNRSMLGAVGVFAAFKAVRFSREVFDQVSAFGELADQIDNTFGKESAGRIKAFAETISGSVGRSIPELLDVAGKLRLRMSRDFSNQEAEELVKPLLQVSADLSSIFDRDMNEVSDALASALTGTTKPGAGLGLALKVGDLAEFAKTSKAKITAMKTEARQRLIIAKIRHDAAIAEGDAARTIDSLSNRVRALKARWENVLYLNQDKLAPIFHEFVDIAENIAGATMRVAEVFKGWAQTLSEPQGQMLIFLGAAVAIKVALMSTIGAIALIAAGVALLIDDFMVWKQGGDSMLGSIEGLGEVFEDVWFIVKEVGKAYMIMGEALWQYVIKPIVEDLWEGFKRVVKGIRQLIEGDFIGGIKNIFMGLIPWVLSFIGGPILKLFGKLGLFIGKYLFGKLPSVVMGIIPKLIGLFKVAAKHIGGFISEAIMQAVRLIPGASKLLGMGKGLVGKLFGGGAKAASAAAQSPIVQAAKASATNKAGQFIGSNAGSAGNLTAAALNAQAQRALTGNSANDNRQATIHNEFNINGGTGDVAGQVEGAMSSFDPFDVQQDVGIVNE